jgi:hypothetical protein
LHFVSEKNRSHTDKSKQAYLEIKKEKTNAKLEDQSALLEKYAVITLSSDHTTIPSIFIPQYIASFIAKCTNRSRMKYSSLCSYN